MMRLERLEVSLPEFVVLVDEGYVDLLAAAEVHEAPVLPKEEQQSAARVPYVCCWRR